LGTKLDRRLLGRTRTLVKANCPTAHHPELKQASRQQSVQSLSDLRFEKAATIEEQGRDRYRRITARVRCADADSNRERVRREVVFRPKRNA
jgi:endonuclease YncB( thermonuclease family)